MNDYILVIEKPNANKLVFPKITFISDSSSISHTFPLH